MTWPPTKFRAGYSRWSILGFLVGSFAILLLVVHRYLIPAMLAAHNIDERGRKQLAALSSLVLAIVLVCLVAAMVLIIRPGRFFLPRKTPPRVRTTYIDAWEESGRRMETPPEEAADESEPPP